MSSNAPSSKHGAGGRRSPHVFGISSPVRFTRLVYMLTKLQYHNSLDREHPKAGRLATGMLLRSDTGRLPRRVAGCRQLWNSFENSDGDCSCNIAKESASFMNTLEKVCGSGTPALAHAHWVVTAMLRIIPAERFDIKAVRREISKLLLMPPHQVQPENLNIGKRPAGLSTTA